MPRAMTHVSGSSSLCDSANFHVESYSSHCDARYLADCCESWRRHLQTKWLAVNSDQSWTPRCTVVVHARRDTYRAAIGRGGEQTFGSSLIDVRAGKISSRRLDLLCDPREISTAFYCTPIWTNWVREISGSNTRAAPLPDDEPRRGMHLEQRALPIGLVLAVCCAAPRTGALCPHEVRLVGAHSRLEEAGDCCRQVTAALRAGGLGSCSPFFLYSSFCCERAITAHP